MTRAPWMTFLARLAVTISVPVLLIVSPLYYFISPSYIASQYARPGFPPSSRFTPDERQRLSDVLVNYLRGRASLDDMASLRTASGQIALRSHEVEHMVDVKGVTDAFFIAHPVALVLLLLGGWFLWRMGRHEFAKALRRGLWLTGGLMLLVLLTSLIDFDVFFTKFHELFFAPGTWMFFAEDTLIQLYPLVFWIDTTLLLSGVILLQAVVVYVLTIFLARKREPHGDNLTT
jgi:integral membrane protein (TIGR01906 family)